MTGQNPLQATSSAPSPKRRTLATGNYSLYVCLYMSVSFCVCVCLSVQVCVYGRVLPEGVHWAWHEKSRSSYIFKRFVWIMKPFTWQQQLQHTSLWLTYPPPPPALFNVSHFFLSQAFLALTWRAVVVVFFPPFLLRATPLGLSKYLSFSACNVNKTGDPLRPHSGREEGVPQLYALDTRQTLQLWDTFTYIYQI